MTGAIFRLSIAALSAGMLLGACGGNADDAPMHSEGREETHNIRNTEAIGYSGDAIADKIDAALDANDAHNERLRQAD